LSTIGPVGQASGRNTIQTMAMMTNGMNRFHGRVNRSWIIVIIVIV
jgi:hypothetical protein